MRQATFLRPVTGSRSLFISLAVASLWGCAALEPEGPETSEKVWAVTASHQLILFNGGQPKRILERKPVRGLPFGESIVGMDYRVAKGVLYALTDSGRLYILDTSSGQLKPVGSGAVDLKIHGKLFGVDFNPTVDRIRVVNEAGQNLRLHPDTGAMIDFDTNAAGVQPDPGLTFDSGDTNAKRTPEVVAAAYTYNKKDDKATTNFAIDRATGTLVTQGTREGVSPAVHPNTGRLFTVGTLGLVSFEDAAFDIADTNNRALAAIRTTADSTTRLYNIDLSNGRATLVGTIADGGVVRGLAIEP